MLKFLPSFTIFSIFFYFSFFFFLHIFLFLPPCFLLRRYHRRRHSFLFMDFLFFFSLIYYKRFSFISFYFFAWGRVDFSFLSRDINFVEIKQQHIAVIPTTIVFAATISHCNNFNSCLNCCNIFSNCLSCCSN